MMKICNPRMLPTSLRDEAEKIALQLNPTNKVFGSRPVTAAMEVKKKWGNGSTLNVGFLGGSGVQRKRVAPYFHEWEQYANIKFRFIVNIQNTDVRVSFRGGEGSWSNIGVDALLVPKSEPTMVLGWLEDDTNEIEYARVVRHEVGHVLALEHELESPASSVKWDENKLVTYYMGPPNNWSREDVYAQVINKLLPVGMEFTDFDPHSIMCYKVPAEFTKDGVGTPWNTELSEDDKKFISQMYPRGSPA